MEGARGTGRDAGEAPWRWGEGRSKIFIIAVFSAAYVSRYAELITPPTRIATPIR